MQDDWAGGGRLPEDLPLAQVLPELLDLDRYLEPAMETMRRDAAERAEPGQ